MKSILYITLTSLSLSSCGYLSIQQPYVPYTCSLEYVSEGTLVEFVKPHHADLRTYDTWVVKFQDHNRKRALLVNTHTGYSQFVPQRLWVMPIYNNQKGKGGKK